MNIFKKINLAVFAIAICSLLFSGSVDAMREGGFTTDDSFEEEFALMDRAASPWRKVCRGVSYAKGFIQRHTVCRKVLMIGALGLLAGRGAFERGGFSLENARLFGAAVGLVGGLSLDWAYGKYKRWKTVDVNAILEGYAQPADDEDAAV